MAILNFTEIPTASAAVYNQRKMGGVVEARELDAFEKFAEEFFEKLLGYQVIQRVARGQDLSVDLIVMKSNVRYLVSCKHYAHSDRAVAPEHESDIVTALHANNCNEFVGFYSTAPTNSLMRQLIGMSNNSTLPYPFTVWKSSDIESKLLDENHATGWLFAARYFPQSFANLYRRFVTPIAHYKESDVKAVGNGYTLDGPGGKQFSNASKQEIVKDGNEYITSTVHTVFFKEALKEFIDIFPSCFQMKRRAAVSALMLSDVSPVWNAPLTIEPRPPTEPVNEAIMICAVWSLWNGQKAIEAYLRHMADCSSDALNSQQTFRFKAHAKFVTLGVVAQFAPQRYRDLLARLVAFAPAMPLTDSVATGKEFVDEQGQLRTWLFATESGLEFLYERLA